MKHSAVFFDIDGTWFRWQLCAEWVVGMVKAGLLPQVVHDRTRRAYAKYKNREGSFAAWVVALLQAYQDEDRLSGIRVSDAKFVAEQIIKRRGKRVHVFARELARAARECQMTIAAISGSPSFVVEAFARENGIDLWLGTEHPMLDGYLLGGPPTKIWAENKREAIRFLAEKHSLNLTESVAIGDSLLDAPMFSEVGYPLCMNPERELCVQAYANDTHWPVIFESKDVIHLFRASSSGSVQKIDLREALPPHLAHALELRLTHMLVP